MKLIQESHLNKAGQRELDDSARNSSYQNLYLRHRSRRRLTDITRRIAICAADIAIASERMTSAICKVTTTAAEFSAAISKFQRISAKEVNGR